MVCQDKKKAARRLLRMDEVEWVAYKRTIHILGVSNLPSNTRLLGSFYDSLSTQQINQNIRIHIHNFFNCEFSVQFIESCSWDTNPDGFGCSTNGIFKFFCCNGFIFIAHVTSIASARTMSSAHTLKLEFEPFCQFRTFKLVKEVHSIYGTIHTRPAINLGTILPLFLKPILAFFRVINQMVNADWMPICWFLYSIHQKSLKREALKGLQELIPSARLTEETRACGRFVVNQWNTFEAWHLPSNTVWSILPVTSNLLPIPG